MLLGWLQINTEHILDILLWMCIKCKCKCKIVNFLISSFTDIYSLRVRPFDPEENQVDTICEKPENKEDGDREVTGFSPSLEEELWKEKWKQKHLHSPLRAQWCAITLPWWKRNGAGFVYKTKQT